MADDSINNYLNTLIFCIIAKAVTIGLLVLLITDLGWDFVYLIMTIELGLILIVIYAMYTVYKIDKKIKEAKEKYASEKPKLDLCPDYFVRTVESESNNSNGHTVCTNVYTSGNDRYTYTFPTTSNKVDLTTLNANQKNMQDLCTNVDKVFDPSGFSWTDLKARCGILDTYTTPTV